MLREWQQRALPVITSRLSETGRALLVAACGAGKTVLSREVMRWSIIETGKPALFLATRYELLAQTLRALRAGGLTCELEQGANEAHNERVDAVVASVQSIAQRRRLERYAADKFGLVVCDETHQLPSAQYSRVVNHFSGNAKVLGMTATIDRTDKQGLGHFFGDIAFEYGFREAINDGVLVRPVSEHVDVEAIDLARVSTRLGDFSAEELDIVLRSREALHGVAKPVLERYNKRPTIVYTTTVETARLLTETFNSYQTGVAECVLGEDAYEDRADQFERFRAGQFSILVNVGVLVFGVDLDFVSCIVLARPSKSRIFVCQAIGRGLRTHPSKKDCYVIDLHGNVGRHTLVSPADALFARGPAGKRNVVKPGPSGPLDVLELIEAEEKARAEAERAERLQKERHAANELAKLRASVTYKVSAADLFSHAHVSIGAALDSAGHPTADQVKRIGKLGMPIPHDLTRSAAAQLIVAEEERRRSGLATYKQCKLLQRHGVNTDGMTKAEATFRIGRLITGWSGGRGRWAQRGAA